MPIQASILGYSLALRLQQYGHEITEVEWEPNGERFPKVTGRYRVKGTPHYVSRAALEKVAEEQVFNFGWRNMKRISLQLSRDEISVPEWRNSMRGVMFLVRLFKLHIYHGGLDPQFIIDDGVQEDMTLWIRTYIQGDELFLRDLSGDVLKDAFGFHLDQDGPEYWEHRKFYATLKNFLRDEDSIANNVRFSSVRSMQEFPWGIRNKT